MLSANHSYTPMYDLIRELWFLKRDIVSDGYDQALYRLAQEIPMTIHEYPTGESCWTWRVPEKWTCHEAYLETMDGRRLLDYHDHPLHIVSYSLPFEGEVSREMLLNHLHVHPRIPDALPFVFKYYDRDWGLCCSQSLRDSLAEPFYRVVIRSTFEPGMLKVGEVIIPGKSEQCFVLVAHLCHPGMVNDDLSGVVVGLDVARHLLADSETGVESHSAKSTISPFHFTYRLLILPETIGSVAYLSHQENLIPYMVGGLFLEMLGNDSPHALQGSFQPDSQADRCLKTHLLDLDPQAYTASYRKIIDNDERQFNAPGVRIPMLSLSRVEAPKAVQPFPYREYHSSLDRPEIVTQARLEASRDLVLEMLSAWERNTYVVNQFKGEIFCSGYGIWVDYKVNPQGHRRLFEIMERCDGEHTVADIATDLGISFQSTWEVVNQLHQKDLVSFSHLPAPTTPQRLVDK